MTLIRQENNIAENTTVKRSSAISKHVSFWAGQIPAGQTSPKGTISEMAARAFYCCLYAIHLVFAEAPPKLELLHYHWEYLEGLGLKIPRIILGTPGGPNA